MSASWDWPGSRWWRVDLHTHSPASYDFGTEADREAKDWPAWVWAAKRAGLDAVALTDHNTAQGVDAIREAAAALPGAPVILPGVEITANDGTHLLLVMDKACSQAHVDELLGLAQIPVDQRGRPAARSPLSVEALLNIQVERGVVILGAHVNAEAGLLEHDGGQRIAELRHPRLAGVEVRPDRVCDETWLDGSRPEITRVIPQLWCSDSHRLVDAGQRFTWVKMSRPDLEGLRLALLDGNDSLKPASRDHPGDPNRHADLCIESMEVSNAKYMGRKPPLRVGFNPWLNVLIGGRGTGKSTLVDLCRKTLRREAELNDDGDGSLRAAFDKRMRVPANRSDEGLLTADTVVEVIYRKDGARFILSWDSQSKTDAVRRLEGEATIVEEGDIRERFPVRIYSQKQLFDLAKQPHALLTVIDDSPEVRGAEYQRLRMTAETQYLSLCAEARALRAQVADLPARRAGLADLKRKLDLLQQGGQAKALNDYRARRRHDGTWESIQKASADAIDALELVAEGGLAVADLDLGQDLGGDAATEALQRMHQSLRSAVAGLQKSVQVAVNQARSEVAAMSNSPDAVAWQSAVQASEENYAVLTLGLTEAGIANPDEYREILQRSGVLEREIATLEQRRSSAQAREQEAADALRHLRELRAQLTQRRQGFAAATARDLIKVGIEGLGERDGLEDFLRETLGIPRFDPDYLALVEQIAPTEGQAWTFDKLDALVASLREVLADPQKPWATEDRRFESALRRLQLERLDRLALHLPDDRVSVSFRDPRDRSAAWRPLSQGSPGQQTAALLAFVLGYGHEPIILDQPEDDLDNTLIYELLVHRLRETKPMRQVIVVTHNPNIVVHGDAELVVSIEARSGQTQIAFAGGLQEQKARDEICRVMEGGRAAFETRYRRIMLTGGQRDGQP